MRPTASLLHVILLISLFIICGCTQPGTSNTIQSTEDFGNNGPLFLGGSSFEQDQSISGDPCDPNPCVVGELCTVNGEGAYLCSSVSCDELDCVGGQQCIEDNEGRGRCVEEGCSSTNTCPSNEFCGPDGVCLPDICSPSERQCNGDTVFVCAPDGDQLIPFVNCPLGPEQCSEQPVGQAACLCVDDWECPQHMICEQGNCIGRPDAPSCFLEPVPFSASIPTPEVVWGGTADQDLSPNSPFPRSVQVVMTPLVANLTDDNGDGVIDEADTPEIIFMSFCESQYNQNGTLRAIHGGGPLKGKDLFASLGDLYWYQGDDLISVENYQCTDGILDPTAGLAVANLDEQNSPYIEPEIIGVHERDGLVIYNHLGQVISLAFVNEVPSVGPNPTPSVAQLDGEGFAEVVLGNLVFTFTREVGQLIPLDVFRGRNSKGQNGQGSVSCVADLDGDGLSEIVGGGSAYRMPSRPQGATKTSDCVAQGGLINPMTPEEELWCQGELVLLWHAPTANPQQTSPLTPLPAPSEGFCAIADVWGADHTRRPGPDNPLDQRPEVLLIVNGDLHVLDAATGQLIYNQRYREVSGGGGGAPNVGDFDGDGFPEIGSAFARGYVMMDLQSETEACPSWDQLTEDIEDQGLAGRPPRMPGDVCVTEAECEQGGICIEGQCVCGHQSWRRATEDNSSRVTGSTLFDFNGDGAVEVIYNDECFFRVYDGATGETLFKQPSESRTRIEHPIVADVDADGNAEIIFSTSTESGFCSERNQMSTQGVPYSQLYNAGIEVWGDPEDRWVSARRIWNQHAYHITHITESTQVPQQEPAGWISQFGRQYNTYRAQPETFGIAPDLTIEDFRVGLSGSCDEQEGEQGVLNLSLTVFNRGEVRVGPGLTIDFTGSWGGEAVPLLDAAGEALVSVTTAPILPNTGLNVTITYDPNLDTSLSDRGDEGLPLSILASVDRGGVTGFGRERECDEENNEAEATPVGSAVVPELSVELLSVVAGVCPNVDINLLVINRGQSPAREVEIGLYLGNPTMGGMRIDTLTLEEALMPGEQREITWSSQAFPALRSVSLTVVIDPRNQILECDEENNLSMPSEETRCNLRDGK